MSEQRWVFVLRVLDKPGVLTEVAAVFSNRGVSLEAILGSGISTLTTDTGRLILSFRAVERKKEMLQRALQRLSRVLRVDPYLYDAPELRAIAVVKIPATVAMADLETTIDSSRSDRANFQAESPLPPLQVETIAQNGDRTLLISGQPLLVDQTVADLRQRSALLDVVMATIGV